MNVRNFDIHIARLPAKLKLLGFIYHLLKRNEATIHNNHNNVVKLNSYFSNTFLLGDNENGGFIAIQDDYLPWFIEHHFTDAVMCFKTGYIYLVARDEDFDYMTYAIGIKCRSKRLLAIADVINNKDLQVKVCRVAENNEVFISHKNVFYGLNVVESSIEEFIANETIENTADIKQTLMDHITS